MPEIAVHLVEELLRSIWESDDGPIIIMASLTVSAITFLAAYLFRARPQQPR